MEFKLFINHMYQLSLAAFNGLDESRKALIKADYDSALETLNEPDDFPDYDGNDGEI